LLPPHVPLHARPAGALVLEASKFAARVEIASNGRRANGRSILELLALGAAGGSELTIVASGEDAAKAVTHLAELVRALAP
jgi:phosphotransferase system HPr (HPr) family protein